MQTLRKITVAVAALALGVALFAAPAGAQDDARIHLIHGIPGVDVDVASDGAVVFEGFAFGDTQDLSALAGTTLPSLQVLVAGTSDVAIDAGDVALPASGNYTIIAHLDADGAPALAVFENDTSTIAAGEGRLVVRHAAAAPAVDILANGEVAFAGVVNGAEGKVDLAVGTVSAEVVPAGTTGDPVIGPADLPIADGASLTVYAVGSLADDTLTVLTESIAGLGSAPTAVNTGNSPVSDNGSALPLAALITTAALVAISGGVVVRRRVEA
jgi:hypothetical protein